MALAMGCTEYNMVHDFKPTNPADELAVDTAAPPPIEPDGPPTETVFPISMVTPDGVDGEIQCGLYEETVTVTNIGLGELVVEALTVEGDGWTLVHPPLPATLEAEESLSIAAQSSGGTGIMVIHSNDPDVPAREVPLRVEQDEPPSVSLLSPGVGDVISPGALAVFEAAVSDDRDAANDLMVTWSSDVDGEVSSLPAALDGIASLAWNSEARSSGDHTICVDVTDSCGQTASTCTTICQNEGYTEDSIDLALTERGV